MTHSDYDCATNSVIIPANAASVNYRVTAPDDTLIEGDETFTVTLDFAVSGTRLVDPSTVTVTIVDNDTPELCDDCIVSISGGSGVTEGTAATFTLTANPAPSATDADLKVNVRVREPASGMFVDSEYKGDLMVIIPKAGTATFTVDTDDDEVDEDDNIIIANILKGEGYALHATNSVANVLVADNDLPMVSFAAATYDVDEGDAVKLTLNMVGPQSTATTVSIACTAVTTTAAEFSGCPSKVTIPANTASHSFTVQTTQDTRDEPDEDFTVAITGVPTGLAIGSPSLATVTVADDDIPALSIISHAGGTEGNPAQFFIQGYSAEELTVNYTVTQNGDFVAAGDLGDQTITYPAGSHFFRVEVPTVDDMTDETNGEVIVSLRKGSGYRVSGLNTKAARPVTDNDNPPAGTPTVNLTVEGASEATVAEGGTLTITATRSVANTSALSIPIFGSRRNRRQRRRTVTLRCPPTRSAFPPTN